MDVPLPEIQLRFNFSDPDELAKALQENQNGSCSQKLAEFVNSKTQDLRECFMAGLQREEMDAYDQVWAASSGLIKRHWELAWTSPKRFEWGNLESEALELEKTKAHLELKFCNLKRELDAMRETPLYSSCCIMVFQKMMDMHEHLKQMVLKINSLMVRDVGEVKRMSEFLKCATLTNKAIEYDQDQRILGELRTQMLLMELNYIVENVSKQERACRRVVGDILPMRKFIFRKNSWLVNEAHDFLKFMTLVVGVKHEEWELLDYPFYEMLHTLPDLPHVLLRVQ